MKVKKHFLVLITTRLSSIFRQHAVCLDLYSIESLKAWTGGLVVTSASPTMFLVEQRCK